jgi:nitrogen regulatory protein PII
MAMIVVEAVIKPFKMDDVKEALEELGIGGMTVTEVMQAASPRHKGRSFGALSSTGDMVPKIKIRVAAPAHLIERILEAICLHGSSGKLEDGHIVVQRIHAAVRIRTGELDEEALS